MFEQFVQTRGSNPTIRDFVKFYPCQNTTPSSSRPFQTSWYSIGTPAKWCFFEVGEFKLSSKMGLSETRPHFQYMFFPCDYFWGGGVSFSSPWFSSFFTPFFWIHRLPRSGETGETGETSGGGQHDSLESLAAGQLWIEFASAPERRRR